MGTVIADTNFFKEVMSELDDITTSSTSQDSWSRAVSSGFFAPCQVPDLPTVHLNRPFPIVCASCPVDDKSIGYVPFEMTPMYYGIPVKGHVQEGLAIGGVFIESEAFTSQPTATHFSSFTASGVALQMEATVSIPRPDSLLTVSHQAGLSSGAIASALAGHTKVLKKFFIPKVQTWNLNAAGDVKVVDGGSNDNLAIYPLLRRGVKNIVCCVANQCDINSPKITDDSVSSVGAVAGLFGRMTAHDESVVGNEARVVFNNSDWDAVLQGLRDSHASNGSCYYLYEGTVQRNDLIGIAGGYDVKILFVVFTDSPQWMGMLPDDVRKQFKPGNSKLTKMKYIL